MSSGATNNNNGSAATTPSGGPPPLPATKPVLTPSGSYVGGVAGIHSVNKQHTAVPGEKPAIAARPIPPPTLPKYTSSFGKIDRAEREKVCACLSSLCYAGGWSKPGNRFFSDPIIIIYKLSRTEYDKLGKRGEYDIMLHCI